MANINKLLQIMLYHKACFTTGLCYWSQTLVDREIITEKEGDELYKYITENRPSKFSSISAFKSRDTFYYWEYGYIEPRIKWLKKHIKKTKV